MADILKNANTMIYTIGAGGADFLLEDANYDKLLSHLMRYRRCSHPNASLNLIVIQNR